MGLFAGGSRVLTLLSPKGSGRVLNLFVDKVDAVETVGSIIYKSN